MQVEKTGVTRKKTSFSCANKSFLLLLHSNSVRKNKTIIKMKATEQTLQQIDRALRKTAEKFPSTEEATQMTDIHLRVTQESGELVAFDDDDRELMRCVVEQWIDNKDDDFYTEVASLLRQRIEGMKTLLDSLSILKPFSFVLEDDDREVQEELYMVDDDIALLPPLSLDNLDSDLDEFLDHLLKS